MPSKLSYYRIAAHLGSASLVDRKQPSDAYLAYRRFSYRVQSTFDEYVRLAKSPDQAERARYTELAKQIYPLVQAVNDVDNTIVITGNNILYIPGCTPETRKKAVVDGARAIQRLDDAMKNYEKVNAGFFRDENRGLEFYRIWNDEAFEGTYGDEILEKTGFDDPKYAPNYVEQPAEQPKVIKMVELPVEEVLPEPTNPMPTGTTPQQLAAHFAAGIAVDGTTTGDAEKLVKFQRSLSEKYQELSGKLPTLKGDELLDAKAQLSRMGVLSNSIQTFLKAGQEIQKINQKPDATPEERQKALSAGTTAGMLMANRLKQYVDLNFFTLADDPVFTDFYKSWKQPMTKGQDILFKVGLAPEPKPEPVPEPKVPEEPWPNIITLKELEQKGSAGKANIDRLASSLGSIGFASQDHEFRRSMFQYASAINGAVGNLGVNAATQAQYLRTLAGFPDFLKDNYQKMADAAAQQEGYSKAQFDYDLFVLGKKLNLDLKSLNLSDQEPEADTNQVSNNWLKCIKKTVEKPRDLDDAPIGLAKILACSVNAGKGADFSMKKLEKSVDTIMNMHAFQQIAKDPDRCNRLIREGGYSKVIAGMSDPFASVPVDKQREVLEKLKTYKQAGFLSPTAGRSEKWKAYWNAIDDIDLSKPETYANQMKRIFDTGEAYMKGKKALSSDLDRNARFDQCMDGMKLLSEANEYVRDKVEPIVERTNYIRTRWNRNQPIYDLDKFTSQGYAFATRLHKAVEQAKNDPEVKRQLESNPRFEKLSAVHPENDNPARDWEILEKPAEPQAGENVQPQQVLN